MVTVKRDNTDAYRKFIDDFLAPSTVKEKKTRTYFWMFKRFIFDFLIPIFCAYGIYAIIAFTAFDNAHKFIKSVWDGDFTEFDKRLKLARQANVVLHICRMIAYGSLLICSFLWLFGYKTPFLWVWPIQQALLIIILIIQLIMKWLSPTDPSSLLLSASIFLDYQGRKKLRELRGDPVGGITENIVVKLMHSKILGVFVTVLATSKLWWDTKFKTDINIFLIFGIIIIIGHCFIINYYGLLKVLDKLKNAKSTQDSIDDSIDKVIDVVCDLLDLNTCLNQEQKDQARKMMYKVLANYMKQIEDSGGGDLSLSNSLFEGVDKKEAQTLLKDLAIANGREYVIG